MILYYLLCGIIVIIICIIVYYKLTSNINGPYSIDDEYMMELYHDKIKKFEKKMQHKYPLGNDYFTINHGKDYYKFFNRIGELNMQICTDNDNNVIATGSGVLQNVNNSKVWYICDLKVDKKYRGNHISTKMLINTIVPSILKSNKCYGISMNNKINKNNIVNLARKINILNFTTAGSIYIYSLNYDEMKLAQPIIEKYFGSINYISLLGIKDLVLESTNKPLKLLHVNHNTHNTYNNIKNKKIIKPAKDYTHMFCCHETNPMIRQLKKINITTDITASIIHHNMDNYDWNFIQTSEI